MNPQFFFRWVFCNLLAFALCVPTLLLGSIIMIPLPNSVDLSTWNEPIRSAAGFALPVILWSVLVGFLQWVVLRRGMILLCQWLLATMAGWLAVMVIVLYFAVPPFNNLGLSPMLEGGCIGLIAGTVVGTAQAFVIRKHLRVFGRWVLANAASYLMGSAIVAIILATVPYGEGPGEGILLGLAYWILPMLVGVFVGVGTGIVLSGVFSEAELRAANAG